MRLDLLADVGDGRASFDVPEVDLPVPASTLVPVVAIIDPQQAAAAYLVAAETVTGDDAGHHHRRAEPYVTPTNPEAVGTRPAALAVTLAVRQHVPDQRAAEILAGIGAPVSVGWIVTATWWFHVACRSLLTLLVAHRSRGQAAVDDARVLGAMRGALVHDPDLRWKAAAGLAIADEAFHPIVLTLGRNKARQSAHPSRPRP